MSGIWRWRNILGIGVAALLLVAGMIYVERVSMAEKSAQLAYKHTLWLTCAADDDCVIVPSVCPGFFWSINARFVADNVAQNARLAPLIDCGPPPNHTRPLRPYCQSGQCVMPRQPA